MIEVKRRQKNLQRLLNSDGISCALLAHPVTLFYMTGVLADGYFFLPADGEGILFVRRSTQARPDNAVSFKSPAQIPQLLAQRGITVAGVLGLEEEIPVSEWKRLTALFPDSTFAAVDGMIDSLRVIKSKIEQDILRRSAVMHMHLQGEVPKLYRAGMTDLDLAALVEYLFRVNGHLGVFRARGLRMEGFLSSVLAGDNGCAPSPYDFALGGQGRYACVPFGPTGEVIRPGQTVMVDCGGHFEGYITDVSRTYAIEYAPPEAWEAHEVSRAIVRMLEREAKPGALCSALYEQALAMAAEAGLSHVFMGVAQQAKFVGHGVGLYVNEAPVLSKRSREVLAAGMTLALEPKFTLPGIGPVGIENTYLVTERGLENLTPCEENLLILK